MVLWTHNYHLVSSSYSFASILGLLHNKIDILSGMRALLTVIRKQLENLKPVIVKIPSSLPVHIAI